METFFVFIIVAAHLVLGADIDSRNDLKESAKEFQDAVTDFLNLSGFFAMSPPLYKIYPTKLFKRLNNAMDRIGEFSQALANEHVKRIKMTATKDGRGLGMSLLEKWLIVDRMSEEEAVNSSVAILSSGVDNVRFDQVIYIYNSAIDHVLNFHKNINLLIFRSIITAMYTGNNLYGSKGILWYTNVYTVYVNVNKLL